MPCLPSKALPLALRLTVKLLARTASYFLRSVFVLLVIASALYACSAHAAVDERGINYVEPEQQTTTQWIDSRNSQPVDVQHFIQEVCELYRWTNTTLVSIEQVTTGVSPNRTIHAKCFYMDSATPPRPFNREPPHTLGERVTQSLNCPATHPNGNDTNNDNKPDRCYAYSCGASGGKSQSGSGLFTSDAGSSGKGCSKTFFESFSPYQCEFEYEHQFTISGSANSPGGKGGIGWKAKYTGKTCGVEEGAEEDVPELITGDEYDPQNQCFTSPNGHKVCAGPQTPEGCASMGGKTVCIDEAPVNNDPCKNNLAGAFCQSAKLPVEGAPTGQADFTGTHPGTGQTQNFYFGGRATGAALGSGSGSDGSGDDGDCDPATETCGDGNGNGDCQGANCGGGNWYEPSNKTYKSVMKDFRSRMEQTPIYNAAGTYLNVSISGSCPNWTLPSTAFTPAYSLSEYFCGETIMTMLAVMKAALLILCSWLAFRIALL